MLLSICMIMKNEEKNLEECLKRLDVGMKGANCELILVDTGSTDKTKEIAARYTTQLYDFQWVNDFAAARNYSISKASGDFILVVDCDEWLEKVDLHKVIQKISEYPHSVGRIIRINEYTRGGEPYRMKETVSRLFPREEYHYVGSIHEQLVRRDGNGENIPVYELPMSFLHCGYEGDLEERKAKAERNITLLKHELEQKEDPYILYQLGKSYYMQENYKDAEQNFDRALWFDLDPELVYVQDMVVSYGYTLLALEKYEKAMQLMNLYDTFKNTAEYVFVIALILMNNGYSSEAIQEFEKVTRIEECRMEGTNSYLAFYNMGVIEECRGHIEEAIQYYRKAGSYDKALRRLKGLVGE